MTPQERALIDSVFSRLSQSLTGPKDPEAQGLIAERVRAFPDAPYGLVQAVLVQENLLKQAQERIADLERRVSEAQAAPAASGSFLNQGNNPWAQSGPARSVPPQQPYAPQAYAQPVYQQPAPQASPWGGAAAPGGFLRQAATTAVGVAGGMLVAEELGSLFSGHHGGFGGGFGGGYDPASGFSGQPEVVENVVVNNYYGDSASDSVQSTDYSSGDDGSSFGGGDDFI